MKRTLLFLAVSFVIGVSAQANERIEGQTLTANTASKMHLEPVVFIERGVEFLVYPDGTLDFNLPPASISLNGRRVNQIYYNPNSVYGSNQAYRKGYIQYNRNGQVAQIGNLNIDYHRNGSVEKIGDIALTYKKGRLDKIGNLKMHYDRSGRIYKQTGTISKAYEVHGVRSQTVYSTRSRRS
ncbi:hypothetical protein [Leeuwenhoekiella sp. ZYFB001]|uniref:hypothetical protein n=1 Tax=Leeuwenhoekiella sp. ZYFB001 TaxID=2719912 RepID=UPI0014312B0D|nr:hypothetical protein [Leeuwenhoekiella sp. ZYFB001]